jgi:hypothetical protein
VYGGRSRFISEKVLKTMEQTAFHGAQLGEATPLGDGRASTLDVSARLKDMW